jgi:hypothetical protein
LIVPEQEADRPARWPAPGYYGGAEALQAMGSVAAPLLAGFSITVVTVVLTSSQQVRWPGIVVILATIATIALISSVQFTFWAREVAVSPEDMRRWWDDADTVSGRAFRVAEMRSFQAVHRRYAARARYAYDGGIVALLLALGAVLVPPSAAAQPALRWAAACLAALAAVFEIVWTYLARFRETRHPPALFGRLGNWLVLSTTHDERGEPR